MLAVLVVVLLAASCEAFRSAHDFTRSSTSANMFNFSNLQLPSFSKAKAPTISASELKSKIIAESKGTSNGIKATPTQREAIAGLVASLEKLNKSKKPAASPLIDGVWKLAYTTNEGSSAGKIGPFVGEVLQIVNYADTKYVNDVKLLGGALQASLTADWDVLGADKWQVNFRTLALKVLGVKVSDKPFGNVSGIWRMTYIDENMRVLYAQGGKNTVKENVYVLVKE
ncbi:hypothetical protein B484DRAFT_446231 [Ochromonadaceae sp. CCMP2298]|nr:hypothetical protein B484DRAFT_446231 [Ochromonadaceae sp. CCMP2298]